VACLAAPFGAPTTTASATPVHQRSAEAATRGCGHKSGHAHCLALLRTDLTPSARAAGKVHTTDVAPVAGAYGPSDISAAYEIPTTLGAGDTVAVVDAYDDPDAQTDLATYRSEYGLPPCGSGCFSKVGQNGGMLPSPAPPDSPTNIGWGPEISLDVDMVSAACPLCKILLVEADSDLFTDLTTAANFAATQPGVNAVSNSYGNVEFSGQDALAGAYNHPGVAITVAAGDDGYGTNFPASLPTVISVGGTSLVPASNARGWTETVWNDLPIDGATASGCSATEAKPTWQTDTVGCPNRTMNDIAAVADPFTGVSMFDSYDADIAGWNEFGGTSAASPIVAAMYAIAGGTSAQSTYVPANAAGLNDVTSGNDGSCTTAYLCTAEPGYDGPTGNGTPYGLTALTGSPTTATSTTTALTINPPGPAGAGTTETLTATLAPVAAAGTVQFSDGSNPLGVPVTVSGGTATMTTVLAPGTHSLTAAFTPTNTNAFGASTTTQPTMYTVNTTPAVTTATTLAVTPPSPAGTGATETLTATVNPTDAVGTVQFLDGAGALGSAVPVAGGTAAMTTVLVPGDHSLTATFTPTSAAAFTSSTSAVVPYTVQTGGGTSSGTIRTLTTLHADPDRPVYGDDVHLTAVITQTYLTGTGCLAGTVAFTARTGTGWIDLGSATTDPAGVAHLTVTAPGLPLGTEKVTGFFTPTDTVDCRRSSGQIAVAVHPAFYPSVAGA
jgi:hypothetical protein